MNYKPTISNGRESGVTLLELMIVVVIIGIIASIAYPSYVKQARKAARTDATSALLAIAAAQEKEFLRNNAYTASLETLGITETEANKYDLSVQLIDGGGFRAIAKPSQTGNQSQAHDAECTLFSIDHTGAKRSEGLNGDGDTEATDSCW